MAHIDFLDEQLEALSQAIEACLAALSVDEASCTAVCAEGASDSATSEASTPLTFTRAVELLDTIPGVDRRGAALIIAEIGIERRPRREKFSRQPNEDVYSWQTVVAR